jgi:phage terminase large subunit-like protein
MIFNPGQRRAMKELLTTISRFCLLYGGSRSGKTFLFVSAIIDRALIAPGSRHLIIRKTAGSAVRAIVQDTFPKCWASKYPDVPRPEYNAQLGRYIFDNGSEVWIGGVNTEDAVERLLGSEYSTIYVNEASEVPYGPITLLRSRLAQVVTKINGKTLQQRFYADLNPTTTRHWTYQLFVDHKDPETSRPLAKPEQYKFVQINPGENADNLSQEYLDDLDTLSSRARTRFLLGNYGADAEGALWKRDDIRVVHLKAGGKYPVEMIRIIVAVDPAASNNPGSDSTGIVAVALGSDGRGYVLDDVSGKFTPEEWSAAAVALYRALDADLIVAERNQGGQMVESMIKARDRTVRYKSVWASDGKITRAAPIAALYDLGKVTHLGDFPLLVDEMAATTIDFDRNKQGWSPDRVDALVWGFTELFPRLTNKRNRGSEALDAPTFSMV